ncbi:uncharacterized protein MYCFIDRAFT_175612 [Pseudocercospora fijiensis CIRAD86]|uniref:Transcription factor domain-containing protein n=1 Tax=Pseudocercospora fijiensis (strain CIRAD86) TaxID=383855 RepID=M3AY30_PSEFD|nr:uncharacterized protein MYCFIDRAFT_175612 [Pseudocercospora fijiensis CIRAD86]EME82063.1 hypothetical protein MYCFIDRAFT_175612 [Pseudocercospora fijiensis CIRAD86]
MSKLADSKNILVPSSTEMLMEKLGTAGAKHELALISQNTGIPIECLPMSSHVRFDACPNMGHAQVLLVFSPPLTAALVSSPGLVRLIIFLIRFRDNSTSKFRRIEACIWNFSVLVVSSTPCEADVTCNRDADEGPDVQLAYSFANDTKECRQWRLNICPALVQTPRERYETVCHRNQLVRQAYIQSSMTATMLANAQLSNHEIDNVYLTVLQDFQPHSGVRIFCGDRVPGPAYNADYSTAALCIRGLLPLAQQSGRAFDLALCSVLTLYLGMLRSDAGLIQVAKFSYADALGLFHVGARSAPNRVKILACVAFALQLYEVNDILIDQVDISSVAFETHIEGAIELIRECGPSAFTSSAFQNTFSSFRNILVSPGLKSHRHYGRAELQVGHSITRRRPSFLHQPDWLLMPFIGRRKSSLFLSVFTGSRGENFQSEVEQLLQDIDELLRQLKTWFGHASLEYGGTAVRPGGTGSSTLQSTLSNTPSSFMSFERGDLKVQFPNGPAAGLFMHYWVSLLDPQEFAPFGFCSVIPWSCIYLDLAGEDYKIASMKLLSSRAAAREAALLALEASTWPSSTLEGIVALQFPLKTLERYFS